MGFQARKVTGPSGPWVVTALSAAIVLAISGCRPDRAESTTRMGRAAGEEPPMPCDVWPPRAVWVVRQLYHSPQQIADLMDDVRRAGLNTVLFQVRGHGTAFYKSSIEPFQYDYAGADPGFDPLAVACREAHRRGLALHAWVNVMPAWHGTRAPADPEQLYHARPQWFWYDQFGKRQPLSGFYVSLNPCLPEVRRYLVGVFQEIVARYPVDGLHLDYIRFPREQSPKGSDYPHDHVTLARYRKATGSRPQDDPARWSAWRTAQVTQLLRDIRAMIRRVRPQAKLTAACAPDIEEARKHFFQDGPAWLRADLVDLVFMMNYSPDTRTFRLRQEAWQRAAGGKPVAAGIGLHRHESPRATVEQLKLADQWGQGFSLFSANCLFTPEPQSRRRLGVIRPTLLGMQARAASKKSSPESPLSLKSGATRGPGHRRGASPRSVHGVVP